MKTLGEITYELESILHEMVVDQDMQLGDILAHITNYVKVHLPEAIEEYEIDSTNPAFLYGHKDDVKKWASKL